MRPIRVVRSLVPVVAATVLLTSCANLSGMFAVNESNGGPSRVEDLVTRIERVHVECEVSRERVRESVAALRDVLNTTQGDPLVAFTGFERALQESEKQAKAFRAGVAPMKRAAAPFFEQWSNDLQGFTSTQLRQQSQDRLDGTRAKFDAIVNVVEPTQAIFDAFNDMLRDRVLFLGHDFNAASVGAVRAELPTIEGLAADLVTAFENGMTRTRDYVLETAPPVRLEPEQGVTAN